jgi:hypothetical protein
MNLTEENRPMEQIPTQDFCTSKIMFSKKYVFGLDCGSQDLNRMSNVEKIYFIQL